MIYEVFSKNSVSSTFEYKSSGQITISYFNEIYPRIFAHLSAARFIKDLSIASYKKRRKYCFD